MSAKSKLNGSVDLLAKAMRQVFTEAVEQGVMPLGEKISGLESRMDGLQREVRDGLETTNKNVQVQLAQHRKDVSSDVRRIVKRQPSR